MDDFYEELIEKYLQKKQEVTEEDIRRVYTVLNCEKDPAIEKTLKRVYNLLEDEEFESRANLVIELASFCLDPFFRYWEFAPQSLALFTKTALSVQEKNHKQLAACIGDDMLLEGVNSVYQNEEEKVAKLVSCFQSWKDLPKETLLKEQKKAAKELEIISATIKGNPFFIKEDGFGGKALETKEFETNGSKRI